VQRLVERLTQDVLVVIQGIIAEDDRGRPREELRPDLPDHLVVGAEGRIEKLRDTDAGHAHRARRRNDMGKKPTANLEPVHLVKVRVRLDGRELQNLIKGGDGARGLGIVKTRKTCEAPYRAVTLFPGGQVPDPVFQRLLADLHLFGQVLDRLVIVDIEPDPGQGLFQKVGRHQQLGGKLVGLNLDGIRRLRRNRVPHEDRKLLIDMYGACDDVPVQHEMPHSCAIVKRWRLG